MRTAIVKISWDERAKTPREKARGKNVRRQEEYRFPGFSMGSRTKLEAAIKREEARIKKSWLGVVSIKLPYLKSTGAAVITLPRRLHWWNNVAMVLSTKATPGAR